tara:strand:- start:278 stop:616 length:339 start_codon:yes stop_codon:yes gene_type:complete
MRKNLSLVILFIYGCEEGDWMYDPLASLAIIFLIWLYAAIFGFLYKMITGHREIQNTPYEDYVKKYEEEIETENEENNEIEDEYIEDENSKFDKLDEELQNLIDWEEEKRNK